MYLILTEISLSQTQIKLTQALNILRHGHFTMLSKLCDIKPAHFLFPVYLKTKAY